MIFRRLNKRERIQRELSKSKLNYCEDQCTIENCKDCDQKFPDVDDILDEIGDREYHSRKNGD